MACNSPMPDFRSLELPTPRLLLRPLRGEDVDALFALYSDPEVARYGSRPAWTERTQAERMIEQDQLDLASGTHIRLAIMGRADGALLGTLSLFEIDLGSRRAEVGYGLAPLHWGHGYAQEAVRALLAYAFGPLDLNRVQADIDPANQASGRLLERMGFKFEGVLRERWIVAGVVSDSAMYGLLQREWLGACSA